MTNQFMYPMITYRLPIDVFHHILVTSGFTRFQQDTFQRGIIKQILSFILKDTFNMSLYTLLLVKEIVKDKRKLIFFPLRNNIFEFWIKITTVK